MALDNAPVAVSDGVPFAAAAQDDQTSSGALRDGQHGEQNGTNGHTEANGTLASSDQSTGTHDLANGTRGGASNQINESQELAAANGTRDTANQTTNGTSRSTPNQTSYDNDIPLSNVPAYSTQRKLRIITIGAGFSGLMLAHKLRYEHPEMEDIVSNTIFEARPEVGGTWLANSYPGVRCDVPSHIYAFPFDPNPDWDHFYSTGGEIQAYIKATVQKWNLDRDLQLNTKVTGAYWQEDLGQWKVTVEAGGQRRDEYADIVVAAQGFLSTWKWPDISGLQKFQGHKVHSASWDHSYDYSNKKIGIIGNGSSGIQILPQMAKLEGTDVTSFQRGPSWIVARMDPGKLLGKPGLGDNPEYTEEDKRRFREDPKAHHQYRKNLIHSINRAFKMVCLSNFYSL